MILLKTFWIFFFQKILTILSISILLLAIKTNAYCQVIAASSGPWNSVTTWVGGAVPGDGDQVIINAPNNVTISVSETHNANISGTGILTVNNALSINNNINFSISTINNNNTIGGTGIKTYDSGVIINNASGTLSGGNHILSNGATMNANGSVTAITISQTTFENHGTFNLQTGTKIQGVSTNTLFINETDGVVNVITPTNNTWENFQFTNKGAFNKTTNTSTTFNTNFGNASFINDVGVILNIAVGQTINFVSNSTTLNGTVNNNGTLTFSAPCILNGTLVNNGTWNVNSAPTINAGSSLVGNGILNVNTNLAIPYNITFSFATINNNGNISGVGTKTYPSGIVVNNTDGTLSGGNHILSNGATLNALASTTVVPITISQTTLENHGVINIQSGNKIQGVSTNTFFVNESDGTINVNTISNNTWENLHFTNKGAFNKTTNTSTTFNTNFGNASFINDVGVILNIAVGQTINFVSNSTTLNGTVNNNGTLTFSAPCILNGTLVNNGTWNVNSAPTINAGSSLVGTGILNVNTNFAIPYDITFTFSTINNKSTLGGTGVKTYPSGIIINNTDGTLSGGKHILANGATLNAAASTSVVPIVISQTTLENHGIINVQSGNKIQGVSTNTFFNNESDGVVNVNTVDNNTWQNLQFTNKGSFNKTSNTVTTFDSNFGSASFTNDAVATLDIAVGQTINFVSNKTTLNGTLNNNGTLTFSNLCIVNGNIVNNGTWNINFAPTINVGSTLTGIGVLNVNSSLAIPYDITFTFSTINNKSTLGGTGVKTYPSGIIINNTDGTLSGGKHILANGATLNAAASTSVVPIVISQTTLENHGIINIQSGNKIQGVSTNTFFNNESDGVINISTLDNNTWQNLQFTNKGSFNKMSNTVTTFDSNFGSASFTNDAVARLDIAVGQTINFVSNTTTLNGTLNNNGTLTFSNLCIVNGNIVNNGTWNINFAPTINVGSTLTGIGVLNVNSSFAIPYDITFTFSTINNKSTLGGTGVKTYPSGIIINNTDGTLSGGKHILANGATLNAAASTSVVPIVISQTTLENHGIINIQSGNKIQGVSTNTFFNNESDGVINISTLDNNTWQNLQFTNKGSFNKMSNTVTTFDSNFGSASFTNDAVGSLIITQNQTVTFNIPTILNGVLTINGLCNLNGLSTMNSTATISGTGTLNINNTLTIPNNLVFNIANINLNNNSITGAGTKTYSGNSIVNSTNATLSGGTHIISSGTIFNTATATNITSTTIQNFGTYNLVSGNTIGASNNTYFINENTGIVNINAIANEIWYNINITNNGTLNKTTNTKTQFTNFSGNGSFTNGISGVINNPIGKELLFSNTTTLNGTTNNTGKISLATTTTIIGSILNSGLIQVSAGNTTVNLGGIVNSKVLVSGGTVIDNAGITPQKVTITSGSFKGNGNTVVGDSLEFLGGAIGELGVSGSFSVNGPANINGGTVNVKSLKLLSVVNINNIYICPNTIVTIEPTATWTINNSSPQIFVTGDAVAITPGRLIVKGTINKIGSGTATWRYTLIEFRGQLNANQGTLQLYLPSDPNSNQGFLQGNVQIATGANVCIERYQATLVFSCAAYITFVNLGNICLINNPTFDIIPNGQLNGTYSGNGTINSPNTTNHEIISPGIPIGKLNFNNLTNANSGKFKIEINGDGSPSINYDQISVAGALTLNGGTLEINLTSGFTPAIGNQYTVVTHASKVGTFSNVTGPNTLVNRGWKATYNSSNIVVTYLQRFWKDADGDSYGSLTYDTLAMTLPPTFVTNFDDCDDTDPLEFPNQTWYIDADNDDYGGSSVMQCLRPINGYLLSELTGLGDCNDANISINPAALEICDMLDNDCNNNIDNTSLNFPMYVINSNNIGTGSLPYTLAHCPTNDTIYFSNLVANDTIFYNSDSLKFISHISLINNNSDPVTVLFDQTNVEKAVRVENTGIEVLFEGINFIFQNNENKCSYYLQNVSNIIRMDKVENISEFPLKSCGLGKIEIYNGVKIRN